MAQSAWNVEEIKAKCAAGARAKAPFLPPDLGLIHGNHVFNMVLSVYYDSGKIADDSEIDSYAGQALNTMRILGQLPPDMQKAAAATIAAVQKRSVEAVTQDIGMQEQRGEKRFFEQPLDCKDGRCYRVRGDQRMERPAPLREGAVSPIFGGPLNSFECALEDSCYIEDYQERLEAAGVGAPVVAGAPVVFEISDDEESVRPKAASVVSIDSDRTLTDEEMQ